MRASTSLRVCLCACLFALVFLVSPLPVSARVGQYLLSSSWKGCTGVTPLSPEGGLQNTVEYCPPTGTHANISVSLSAVDPSASLLHLVEAAGGRNYIATSTVTVRTSIERRALPIGVSIVAMTLGVSTSTSLTARTPLLMLTSEPAMNLQSFMPEGTSGTTTPIYASTQAFKQAFNMSHAVSGVLALRNDGPGTNDVREAYWLGLSSATPLLANGSLDTSKLFLYAARLNAAGTTVTNTKVHPLVNAGDVMAMHYSAELKALLLVTSSEVRVVAVPAVGGLTAATSAPIYGLKGNTWKVGTVTITDSNKFVYSQRIVNFAAIYASSRWLPYARQLVIGVESVSGSTRQPRLLSIGISSAAVGTYSVDYIEAFTTDSLPLMLQSSVVALTIAPATTPVSVSAAQTTLTIRGTGFSQAMVRSQLQCVITPSNENLVARASAVYRPATVTSVVTGFDPTAPETLTCTFPNSLLTTGTAKLMVTLLTVDQWSQSQSGQREIFDVNECATSPCKATEQCNNFVEIGKTFECQGSMCAPGHWGPTCEPCDKNFFKSLNGSQPCTPCQEDYFTSTNGSTKSSDCMLKDPCNCGATVNGGDVSNPRTTMLWTGSVSTWTALTKRALQEKIMEWTGLSTVDRIYIADIEDAMDEGKIIVHVEIRPPTAADEQLCRDALESACGVMCTPVDGQCALQIMNNLESALLAGAAQAVGGGSCATSSDCQSAGGSVTTDLSATQSLSWSNLMSCSSAAPAALLILVVSFFGLVLYYMVAPCRNPFPSRLANPIPLRARPFELFPTFLPLLSFGYDVYFIVDLPNVGIANGAVILGIAVLILVFGVVLNLGTWNKYVPAQLHGPKGQVVAPEPQSSPRTGRLPRGSGTNPLAIWKMQHPVGFQVARVMTALNFQSLALFSAQMSSRTNLWDIQWDPVRAQSKPFFAMIRGAGIRSVFLRHMTMLALQFYVLSQATCRASLPAPILAGLLALVFVVARLQYTKHMSELGGLLPRGQRKGSAWGEDSEVSRTGSHSQSTSSQRKITAGDVMSSRPRTSMAGDESGSEEEEEEEEAPVEIAQSDAELARLEMEQKMAAEAKAEAEAKAAETAAAAAKIASMVELALNEEEIQAAAAGGIKVNEWIVMPDALSGPQGGRAPSRRCVRKVYKQDAERVLARRARAEQERQASIPPPTMAQVVVRAAVANAAAREVAASHMWTLFDDPLQDKPVAVAPDVTIKEVEQFKETDDMPFQPACFRVYLAKKKDVKARAEAAKSVADLPQVRARVAEARQLQAELDGSNQWEVLDDPKPAAPGMPTPLPATLLPNETVKAVEIFDEYGAPFDPAMYRRYVLKNNNAARAELRQQQLAEVKANREAEEQARAQEAARIEQAAADAAIALEAARQEEARIARERDEKAAERAALKTAAKAARKAAAVEEKQRQAAAVVSLNEQAAALRQEREAAQAGAQVQAQNQVGSFSPEIDALPTIPDATPEHKPAASFVDTVPTLPPIGASVPLLPGQTPRTHRTPRLTSSASPRVALPALSSSEDAALGTGSGAVIAAPAFPAVAMQRYLQVEEEEDEMSVHPLDRPASAKVGAGGQGTTVQSKKSAMAAANLAARVAVSVKSVGGRETVVPGTRHNGAGEAEVVGDLTFASKASGAAASASPASVVSPKAGTVVGRRTSLVRAEAPETIGSLMLKQARASKEPTPEASTQAAPSTLGEELSRNVVAAWAGPRGAQAAATESSASGSHAAGSMASRIAAMRRSRTNSRRSDSVSPSSNTPNMTLNTTEHEETSGSGSGATGNPSATPTQGRRRPNASTPMSPSNMPMSPVSMGGINMGLASPSNAGGNYIASPSNAGTSAATPVAGARRGRRAEQ